MKKQVTLVIEHCESQLSEWLLLEYRHAVKLWRGDVVFTNVHDTKTANELSKLGRTEHKQANKVFHGKRCIILDPQAKNPLKTKDFSYLDALIVGGILGYEQPQGRTKTLLSDTSDFETRHLGPLQLTIDSAVFVAQAIAFGMNLRDIEITYEIEIVHDQVHSTVLPFGYPVVGETAIITPGLVEYLSRE